MAMIDSSASHSFVTESVVKLHYWLENSTEPMSIHLTTASEVVSDFMCAVSKCFVMLVDMQLSNILPIAL